MPSSKEKHKVKPKMERTVKPKDVTPNLYHEKQVDRRCGLHALNNAMQVEAAYTHEMLKEAAQDIAKQQAGKLSNLWKESGDYDRQVLRKVLTNNGINSVMLTTNMLKSRNDLNNYQSIIVHKQDSDSHWYVILRHNAEWYIIDSLYHKPHGPIGENEAYNIIRKTCAHPRKGKRQFTKTFCNSIGIFYPNKFALEVSWNNSTNVYNQLRNEQMKIFLDNNKKNKNNLIQTSKPFKIDNETVLHLQAGNWTNWPQGGQEWKDIKCEECFAKDNFKIKAGNCKKGRPNKLFVNLQSTKEIAGFGIYLDKLVNNEITKAQNNAFIHCLRETFGTNNIENDNRGVDWFHLVQV